MAAPMFTVDGADQLRRSMRKAGVDMTRLKDAHRDVADTVSKRARGTAPQGPTGRLAASTRPGATQKAAIIRAGKKSVPYAGPIHWGWPRRGIRAQPWLQEAAQESEPEWVDTYTTEIERLIAEVEGA